MIIKQGNSTISVAKKNGYELEKVKYAIEFLKKANRHTTPQEYLEAYNYINNKSEKLTNCKSCATIKYKMSVENYARYGRLTLINNGLATETDFIVEAPKPEIENKEERIVTNETPVVEETVEVETEVIEPIVETVEETEVDAVVETKKRKKKSE